MSDQKEDAGATVAALRRRLASMSGSAGQPGPAVLAVPEPLTGVLPRRGLVRGAVTEVSGAMTLPAALLAAATAAGATAALVGLPQLNLAMAADLGADLSRIAVVEEPGVDRLEVAGVLLDGVDLVLVAVSQVTPSRARVLGGRARRQGAVLVAVGAPGSWPGATVRLSARIAGYRHLPLRRNGYGRIGGLQVDIGAAGSGVAPREIRCELVTPGYGESGALRLTARDSRVQGRPAEFRQVAN
ncbi:hypothetical protein GOHSU_12_00480 [Gordonia hirsuta DSM 44140 = NBRC 16056]|uniref:Recombinase A n=1 Tax=Gordonia hirsuta DSM 44140 = NBRC 16056 TaxID=1121927 RepID=L7L9E9_9ACTN|nr:hypothetical protein [Gordonia hirsuta]GAC56658.1 hypothetical protein GOHSU_12_00480 [Gordonia hirsuta DSM 44140 = NBRC 16056]